MPKKLAIIYFQPEIASIAKVIASAIRDQRNEDGEGNAANLVYANLFQDKEDCVSCNAVVIQADAPNVHKIIKAYQETMPTVEFHFFDKDGEFVSGPSIEKRPAMAMPGIKQDPKIDEKLTEAAKQEQTDENADTQKTDPGVSEENSAATGGSEAPADEPAATKPRNKRSTRTSKS